MKELLSRERMKLIRSWPHSGFNVHVGAAIAPEDTASLTRISRYMLRASPMLSWITYDRERATVRIDPHSSRSRETLELDVLDFITRLAARVPGPHERLVHYYGPYSNASRQRRVTGIGPPAPTRRVDGNDGDQSEWIKARRIRWSRLIRLVWLEEPMLCPRCGGTMRIISFITDQTVIDKILRHIGWKHCDRPPPLYRSPPKLCASPLG